MEEKLKDLFVAVNEFSEKSDKLFMEIDFSGEDKKLEISIRKKHTFDYVEIRSIYLEETEEKALEDLLKFVKEY